MFRAVLLFTLVWWSVIAASILATGCSRIETGEVGVRVGLDDILKLMDLLNIW